MVKVDLSGARPFFDSLGPDYAAAAEAHRAIAACGIADGEPAGWIDLPRRTAESGELKSVIAAAGKIRRNSQLLVVVGFGGACAGARAAIELLTPESGLLPGGIEVCFAPHSLSPHALNRLTDHIGERDFSVYLVSESGTTPESALIFRVVKELLDRKYGRAPAKKRIFVAAGPDSSLYKNAVAEGLEAFPFPAEAGGCFGLFSAAGLLPMAAAGIDAELMLSAAAKEMHDLDLRSPDNPAWQYAAARQHLYNRGKSVELLSCDEPAFASMAEWWRRLCCESGGKNGIGIFPAPCAAGPMAQLIKDGPRNLMETTLVFEDSLASCKVPFEMGDPDGFNFLAGRDFSAVSRAAACAEASAHIASGVPNIGISVPARNVEGFAALACFFLLSCAVSAAMSGVDPFDRSGAASCRENMLHMLKQEL